MDILETTNNGTEVPHASSSSASSSSSFPSEIIFDITATPRITRVSLLEEHSILLQMQELNIIYPFPDLYVPFREIFQQLGYNSTQISRWEIVRGELETEQRQRLGERIAHVREVLDLQGTEGTDITTENNPDSEEYLMRILIEKGYTNKQIEKYIWRRECDEERRRSLKENITQQRREMERKKEKRSRVEEFGEEWWIRYFMERGEGDEEIERFFWCRYCVEQRDKGERERWRREGGEVVGEIEEDGGKSSEGED